MRAFIDQRGGPCGGSAPRCYELLSSAAQLRLLHDRELPLPRPEFLALDAERAARLVGSRYDVLRAAGCDPEAAVVVAVHPEVGVGDALGLIHRGCPARTALAILL